MDEFKPRRSPTGASEGRWIAWVFFGNAIAVACIVAWAFVRTGEPLAWVLLIAGIVAIALLLLSVLSISVRKATREQFKWFAANALLSTISIVNFTFFGWYAGEMIARAHGNLTGIDFFLERLGFGLAFMVAITIPYRQLHNKYPEHAAHEKSTVADSSEAG